jgi:hypothetical protein
LGSIFVEECKILKLPDLHEILPSTTLPEGILLREDLEGFLNYYEVRLDWEMRSV